MLIQTFTLCITALIYFLFNFFPISSNLKQSITKPPTKIKDLNLKVYNATANKIIFVVIDALRMDFVTKDTMPFVYKTAIENGCIFKTKVQSPTVTLPRIKSLTVGNIPQFSDAILNLIGTSKVPDSLLHRAKAKGKKLIFYGDDTWLKLYPKIFTRSEGTSSFFVNDFSEVDNNVTRHLDNELSKDDWDLMFLHYLGLDHIGHVYGPYNPLIKTKLLEMDKIIQKLYNATMLRKEKVLVVVTGDHGMKDSGGHGGSTYSEVYVPFVVTNLLCNATEIDQVDIPVTMSFLMGIDIPSSCIGKLITTFSTIKLEKILFGLRYNALHLKNKMKESNDPLVRATNLHYKFLKTNNSKYAYESMELYEQYLKDSARVLIKNSSAQDEVSIFLSFFIIVFSYIIYLSVSLAFYNISKICFWLMALLGITLSIKLLVKIDYSGLPLLLGLIVFIYSHKLILSSKFVNNRRNIVPFKYKLFNFNTFLLVFFIFIQPFTYFSSSFIEEEHQTWYFNASTVFLFITYLTKKQKLYRISIVCLSFVFIYIKKLNQTGVKWASLPDLSDWLLQKENYLSLQLLTFFSLSLLYIIINNYFVETEFQKIFVLLVLGLNYLYRFINAVVIAQYIWLLIIFYFLLSCKQGIHIKTVITAWLLICCLILRQHNIIILPFIVLCIKCLSLLINPFLTIWEDRLVYNKSRKMFGPPCHKLYSIQPEYLWVTILLVLSKLLFFCQGHSNSLSSVDIASGYVGLSSYLPIVVFPLVLIHTYAFPILCILLVSHEFYSNYYLRKKMKTMWNFLFSFQVLSVVVIMICCLIQRNHLFVWSVFAPKLLIECVHIFVLYLVFLVSYFVENKSYKCK